MIRNAVFGICSIVCSKKVSLNISSFENVIKSSFCVEFSDTNCTFFFFLNKWHSEQAYFKWFSPKKICVCGTLNAVKQLK